MAPTSFTNGTGGGVFLVWGRGEVTFVPFGSEPQLPATVGYQVADPGGRTARSTGTVTVDQ